MPRILRMVQFNESFSQELFPAKELIQAEVDKDKYLKIDKWDGGQETVFWLSDEDEWLPILWLEENNYHINADPLIENGSYYILVQLSDPLGCCLDLEDFGLAFIPGYGYLFDPEDDILHEGVFAIDLHEELKDEDSLKDAIHGILSRGS